MVMPHTLCHIINSHVRVSTAWTLRRAKALLILDLVDSGHLTGDNTYEFDDKVLREPADYGGYQYSTYWDDGEGKDPANDVEIKSVYTDVRAPILMAEGGSVGARPAWLQPAARILVLILTNDGYLEQVPAGPPVQCLDKNSASSIITQFSTLPLEQVHHFAYNGEYMNALFKDRKLVDILIHIEDRTFYGHRCILCAHSGYFSSILVDSSVPPYAITDITLKSIDPEQFKRFLNFTYTGEIFLTLANVESFRRLANKLKSKTLRAKIALFLSKSKTVTLNEELLLDPGRLCQLTKEDLLYILQADSLNVDSELDAFWAVLYWVAADPVERAPAMNRLMSAVRFTTMSSLELMDCARVSDLVRLSKRCQGYLINANWVCHVREVGLQDPLGLSKEQKRSSLSDVKPHEPTVAEFDMRFLIYNALLFERKGQILKQGKNVATEGKLHDHLIKMRIPSR
ncbi:kelch-like protein 9 [Elysia marginata]|uniref:Kelch-like protein 9 n=1 Tax=Elysia marginata TaxID=1093978 RepID=A0AAV4HCR9_9GAST|nr:kelch-like protein 9 [Elysia marginata]